MELKTKYQYTYFIYPYVIKENKFTKYLLKLLKEELQLSYLFISHDIQTVTYFCDKVMFILQGQQIELCEINKLSTVTHPYAKKLIQSVI